MLGENDSKTGQCGRKDDIKLELELDWHLTIKDDRKITRIHLKRNSNKLGKIVEQTLSKIGTKLDRNLGTETVKIQ